ncbi:IclR family transcriptional regulator domain-containing protein [Rhodococcus qingshengii]|uniref:IclR family transcriptional regulator domain-containing protein n=1 Tax=Rhodococcus qingshengii TaxID=334542 RepID=UPI0022B50FF7|nr:IclR family transcriptional regulator C-terminal domain-containing protein [Rhodococcus qingshengii]MCZ4618621.1 helix-turn-helix domain-containing protein [Rhodococcus qingshengii]
MKDAATSRERDIVQAVGRGLDVLRVFGTERRALSVTEVASLTGITRSAARRFVLTLEHMGHLAFDGNAYIVRPAVLEIGDAYILSSGLPELVHPYLERLAAENKETASLTVMHDKRIVYVDRVQADRVLTVKIVVGTSLPAYAVATGRMLLADLSDEEIDNYLESTELRGFTERSTVAVEELRSKIHEARENGWALVDQELSDGVRSIAVPIRCPLGRAIAVLNVSAQSNRVTLEHLRTATLATLQAAATEIEADLKASSR